MRAEKTESDFAINQHSVSIHILKLKLTVVKMKVRKKRRVWENFEFTDRSDSFEFWEKNIYGGKLGQKMIGLTLLIGSSYQFWFFIALSEEQPFVCDSAVTWKVEIMRRNLFFFFFFRFCFLPPFGEHDKIGLEGLLVDIPFSAFTQLPFFLLFWWKLQIQIYSHVIRSGWSTHLKFFFGLLFSF